MINNFDVISTMFDILINKDDFYFVQIIQRKKDGNDEQKVIKSFYFFTKEQFLENTNYIQKLCDDNNARAYFWINPRNTTSIACECIKQFAELINNRETQLGVSVFDKAVGSTRSTHYCKLWIVDIDSKDVEYCDKILDIIQSCRGDNYIKGVISTVQGYHFITTAFDRYQFNQKLAINQIDPIDIHLDNCTLLYYGKS